MDHDFSFKEATLFEVIAFFVIAILAFLTMNLFGIIYKLWSTLIEAIDTLIDPPKLSKEDELFLVLILLYFITICLLIYRLH